LLIIKENEALFDVFHFFGLVVVAEKINDLFVVFRY